MDEEIEDVLGQILSELKTMNATLKSIQGTSGCSSIENAVDALKSIDFEVSNIDTEASSIDSEVSSMNMDISSISSTLSSIDSSCDSISDSVGNIESNS